MKGIHDGERVRAQMVRMNLTQKELANKIGTSKSTLFRMLNESSWRTDYLWLAGEALNTNFFEPYSPIGNGGGPVLGIILNTDFLNDPDIIKKAKDQLLKKN